MRSGRAAAFWVWLRAFFAERQIYHRRDGTVTFMVLTPFIQVSFATLAFALLCWVAYATVNVVFKNQIIAAKDHRYAVMQAAYEGRIAEMKLAYDELNSLLVLAEDRFRKTTDEIQDKQRDLATLLEQKTSVMQRADTLRTSVAATSPQTIQAAPGANVAPMSLNPAETAPRQSLPEPDRLAAAGHPAPVDAAFLPAANHPAAQRIANLQNELSGIKQEQYRVLAHLEEQTNGELGKLEAILSVAGLDADSLAERVTEAQGATGGPFVALNGAGLDIDGTTADAFGKQQFRIASGLMKLSALQLALDAFPLTRPINGAKEITSGFGPRRDPFTGRLALHAGVDFGGPIGTPIVATAPGTVVWAGRRGPYGNLVEIDHGHGIRTRFGHLNRVSVSVGDKVEFRQKVGELGSTGRSTGPHLHYEVWYNQVVRDPVKFFEAGQYVLQK